MVNDNGHGQPHHSFDIQLATELKSVELALIYGHIKYWTAYNARAKKNFHDGRTWMYQSIEDMAHHFPYFSQDQIRRYLNKLLKLGLIVKGNYNKSSYDRTMWYSPFCNSAECIWRNRQMEEAESPNQFGGIAGPIPYTKTDTEKEKEERESARAKKKSDPPPDKKAYGNEGIVRLTDEQHEKLVDAYGVKAVQEQIVKLEDYMLSTGKKYKDHAATLRNWFRRDKPSQSDAEAKRRDAGSYGTRNHEGFKFNFLGEDGYEG